MNKYSFLVYTFLLTLFIASCSTVQSIPVSKFNELSDKNFYLDEVTIELSSMQSGSDKLCNIIAQNFPYNEISNILNKKYNISINSTGIEQDKSSFVGNKNVKIDDKYSDKYIWSSGVTNKNKFTIKYLYNPTMNVFDYFITLYIGDLKAAYFKDRMKPTVTLMSFTTMGEENIIKFNLECIKNIPANLSKQLESIK